MKYEIHPLAEALPAMSEAEYQGLLADIIQAKGLLDPIILYQGKVLDGRHRLRACEEAGIEPRVEEYTGNDPMAYVLAKNIKRRHLTPSQKAMALLRLSEVVSPLEARAEERRLNNLKKGKHSPIPSRDGIGGEKGAKPEAGKENNPMDAELPQRGNKHATSTTAQLGQLADVSEKTMERAKYVRDHGTPQDIKEVESGEKTVTEKANEIRARQKNTTKTRTRKKAQQQKRSQPETEDEQIASEWKTCLQTLQNTLILDPSSLPPGESRERVARFRRGLKRKTLSTELKDEIKEALEGLIGSCQHLLQQLASAKDKPRPARSQSRSRATTTAFRRPSSLRYSYEDCGID